MRSLQCPVSIKAHVINTKDQARRTVITYVPHWRNAGTLSTLLDVITWSGLLATVCPV